MGNLHLVTGRKGENHVTAADHGSLNAAIFGEGSYVLNRGSKFAASVISNNQIDVADGDLLFQGRHIRLNEKTKISLTIETGTADTYRHDLIVARYTKNGSSGIEDCNLIVIKGKEVASGPADPAYNNGSIIKDGVLIADMPLYRVPLNGINVGTLVALFDEASATLANGAVTASKLASNAVTTEKINASAVTAAKLASSAVTEVKIANAAVTTAKVADGAVTRDKLANDSLYSPMFYPTAADYTVVASDLGKTLMANSTVATSTTDIIFRISDTFGNSVPNGAELAIIWRGSAKSTQIVFEGNQYSCLPGETAFTLKRTYKIKDTYGTVVLKKVNYGSNQAMWLLTGNVEVV